MTGSDDGGAVTGGLARHIPVLARRAVEWLSVRDGGVYVDATFGAGGYTRAILETPGARVVGVDRDQSAIALGADLVAQARGRLDLVEDRLSNLQWLAGAATVDGVVFDLGVSSMQLDEAARGFSFRLDGPLDMRMVLQGPTAADVVACAGERELAAIIADHLRRGSAMPWLSRAQSCERGPCRRSTRHAPWRRSLPKSCTLATARSIRRPWTFQALRIFVNDELAELAQGLVAAEHILKPAARLVVVAFHSLEDRIVKMFLNERARAPAFSWHQPEADGGSADFPRPDASAGNCG